MTDDAQLLRRYAEEGSEPAFAEFVARSLPLVYSAALRRMSGDTHRAREVSQQVFIAAARHARQLSRHDQLTAWLYTATRNAALNLMRNERRRTARERAAVETHTDAPDAGWTEIAPLLDSAMDELGTRDREALLLRFFSGLSFAELGTRCGLGENTARMRVQRALEKLRDRLARRGVTSGAAALALACTQHATAALVPSGMAATVAGGALASGGAQSAPGFLAWLKGSSLAVGGTLGFAALTLLTAIHQLGELHAVEVERDAVQAENRLLAAELRRAERTPSVVTAPERKPAPVLEGGASPASVAPGQPDELAHVKAGREFLVRHPAVGEAVAEWFRAKARFDYAELYRDLGLTPEQSEALGETLRGRVFFGHWGPGGQFLELHVGEQHTPQERDARIREIVGEAGLDHYRRSHREVIGRQLAAQVSSMLFFSETPLTAAQSTQLAGVVTASQGDKQSAAYWQSLAESSAEFLSPAQMEALQWLGRRALLEGYPAR